MKTESSMQRKMNGHETIVVLHDSEDETHDVPHNQLWLELSWAKPMMSQQLHVKTTPITPHAQNLIRSCRMSTARWSDGGEGRTRSHRSICHLVILLKKTKSIYRLSTNWLHEVELHLHKTRQLQDIIMHHCFFATNRIKCSASV